MSFLADPHIGRSAIRRVEVVKVDDTGEIQMVTVQGLKDEFFELPLRGQMHGITGVPSVGATGYLFMANGRPDQAFLMGIEHKDQRPRERKDGETTLYAKEEQEIYMKENGDMVTKTPKGKHRVETADNSEVEAGAEHRIQSGSNTVINTGGQCLINCG